MTTPTFITDPARVEKLLSVVRATRPLPDSTGMLYYASNATGRAQVFRKSQRSGPAERLVESESRMVPHAHTPLGMLVREDHGGNEVWQLGMFGDDGYRPLTTDRRAIHGSVTLHPDQRRVGLSWNPNGQADMILGELDLATGAMARWAEPGGFWSWAAWSPSGDRAAVIKLLGTPEEAYLLDRDGTVTRLLPDALRAHPVEWLEQGLMVMTDLGRDFLGLALVAPDRPDEVARWLFDEDHDLEGVSVAPSLDKAAIVVNEGIHDAVRIVELDSGKVLEVVALPPRRGPQRPHRPRGLSRELEARLVRPLRQLGDAHAPGRDLRVAGR